jgi:hypothetical protein
MRYDRKIPVMSLYGERASENARLGFGAEWDTPSP